MSTSTLLQQLLQQSFNLASATVKWIRYRALYITWISLLFEWRHQSKIWCPFLCTAGFVYACVRLLCTGTQANCGNYGDVLEWLRPLKTKGLRGIRAYSTVCNSYHGGRAHRSHRWGRWFESNCHHHSQALVDQGLASFCPFPFSCTLGYTPLRIQRVHSQKYHIV